MEVLNILLHYIISLSLKFANLHHHSHFSYPYSSFTASVSDSLYRFLTFDFCLFVVSEYSQLKPAYCQPLPLLLHILHLYPVSLSALIRNCWTLSYFVVIVAKGEDLPVSSIVPLWRHKSFHARSLHLLLAGLWIMVPGFIQLWPKHMRWNITPNSFSQVGNLLWGRIFAKGIGVW